MSSGDTEALSAGRFEGRAALVTGGAGDIGGAVVARLRAGGARVATLDLEPSSADGVLSLTGDVRDSTDVDRAVGACAAELGSLDILVCAAGVTGDSLSTIDVGDE